MGPLSVAFIDFCGWDYDVATPTERPLGGSQSALCYLARQLAQRGHRVCLLNSSLSAKTRLGVEVIPRRSTPSDFLGQARFDAVVVLNGPAEAAAVKREIPPETTLVLWTQLAADQPAMAGLGDPDIRAAWDRIVCVSDWHRDTMIAAFGLEPKNVSVRRNAISPFFESLFSDPAELHREKSGGLHLAYTSTPFRGLDLLLDVFPGRADVCDLAVYSSMGVYQVDAGQDPFAPLYERARRMPRVTYVGSVPQQRLAQDMRRVSVLSYPNTFPETSCIAVMEAMAAGCLVVTSALGALPETTLGLADLVPIDGLSRAQFAEEYAACLDRALDAMAADRHALAARLYEQVRLMNAHHTWRTRALEWEAMFMDWRHARSLL